MTEKELIKLKFKKIIITDKESDNGYDFYFYQKQYCSDLTLCTTDSIEVENDVWKVSTWEIPAISIITKKDYNAFIKILDIIICDNVNVE